LDRDQDHRVAEENHDFNLITDIDRNRQATTNLSSALRVFVLKHYREAAGHGVQRMSRPK
jgi:predicted DNA-binding ribbon-helix-helix protein